MPPIFQSHPHFEVVAITSVSGRHGYHVLCEKPMALNLYEAQAMITARNNANRFGAINFEFRYLSARKKVKEIISSGQLGRVIHIRYQCNALNYISHHPGHKSWKEDKSLGGGTLNSIGSHMIDSIQWWLQEPITSVSGQTPIHFPELFDVSGKKHTRTSDDSFQAIGSFQNGSSFEISFLIRENAYYHPFCC